MLRPLRKFGPSELLANVPLGSLLLINKRRYVLFHVDPWFAYVIRYTWFDLLNERLGTKFGILTGRKYISWREKLGTTGKENTFTN